jgi:8-oxo-dGTP pyrophosphatase MutT (NUDIX family)
VIRDNQFIIVHRPKYNDWSLPKGKLKNGESFLAGALREILEETYCQAKIHQIAGAIYYPLNDGYKFVLFWVMTPQRIDTFIPNDEIDQIKWIEISHAQNWLRYAQELELLHTIIPDQLKINRVNSTKNYKMSQSPGHLEEAISLLESELERVRRYKITDRINYLRKTIQFLQNFRIA